MPPDSFARAERLPWGLATADVAGLARDVLDDAVLLAGRLDGALAGRAGPFVWRHHRFAPGGLSLVGTAPDARVVLHTWPERDLVTIDLYAPTTGLEQALEGCVESLRAS